MAHSSRLSLLARGPGLLAVVLGVAVLATAAHRGHGAAATTLTPPVRAALTSQRIASDPASKLAAWAAAVRVVAVGPRAGARMLLDVLLQLRNPSARSRTFDAGSFYLVAAGGAVPPGTTIAAQTPAGVVALGRGTLEARSTRSGWEAFALRARSARYLLIWSDDDRLLTPATVASIEVVGGFPPRRP